MFKLMASDTYEHFLQPLVGSPEAIQRFQRTLTGYIKDPIGPIDRASVPRDPYYHLLSGVMNVIDATAATQLPEVVMTSLGERPRERVARLIKLGGAIFPVSALRAVGALYERHAHVPQHSKNVQRNTRKVLGHVLSMAMTDQDASMANLMANHLGFNPRNWLLTPLYRGLRRMTDARSVSFVRAFEVTTDDNGQLSFELRYPNKKGETDARCPATYARTEIAPGQTERSLWLYLQAIGDVAMAEIFPHQFAIAKE